MIKYRTGGSGKEIEALEVVRETDHYITFVAEWWHRKSEQREKKETSHSKWFDTWEEAHAFLLERARKRVFDCEGSLHRAHERLRSVEAMKP